MTQNIWYTVARTSDSECAGRVLFSIGGSSLSFDVFIQFGNISISIVSAEAEADTVFSMRVRNTGEFYYVDVRSDSDIASTPSFSVNQVLGTLTVLPFMEAGDGRQECIVSTDSWAPAPVADTYVTTDTIQAVTALKYFEDGIAIGDHDSYWALVYGSDGVYVGGKRIITAQDVLGYATQNWVLAKGYITSAALTGYVNGGAYDSDSKKIELKHDSTVIAQIDATAFIKDGMVDTVSVDDGYLVITFNTDSGKEDISIALTDIFDPSNYYTKTEVDGLTAKTTARSDSKLLYNGQTVEAVIASTGISSSNNLLNNNCYVALRANSTNPFIGLKQGTNLWYAQAASNYFYFGPTSSKALRLDQSGNGVFQTGSVTATAIIKKDGTSSQFLKADGSVDSSTYLTSVAFGDLTSHPTTLSGYGITDAKIESGTITLGSDTITPLTSFTESDPVFSASDAAGIDSTDISNWNTAYGWGDHAQAGYLTSFTETDPTVPSWAKASSKPSYTFSEIGSKPTTLSGYGITDAKISSGTITLGSNSITPLTSHQSLSGYATETWVGQQGFLTSYTETDPIFSASEAASITSTDTSNWDTAYGWGDHSSAGYLTSVAFSDLTATPTTLSGYGITDAKISSGTITLGSDTITPLTSLAFSGLTSHPTTLSGYGITDAKISSGTITLGSDTITPLTSFTETDPTVPSWAKASSKPSYTFSEIGTTPTTLSGYGITDAKIENGVITLGSSTITPLTSFTESDPTVPSWAKASSKPTYGLSEITGTDDLQAIEALTGTSGLLKKTAANTWALDTNTYALSSALSDYVPTTRKVNSKALSADITLSLDDVANGSTRKLPTKVSDLTNDSGFITSYTETDPVFSASASAQITAEDVSNWDDAYGWGDHAQAGYLTSVAFSNLTAHPTTLSGYGITDAKIENGTITLGSNTITPLTSFTESDPTVPSWAKASSKPTYTASEVGALPSTTTIPSSINDLDLILDASSDYAFISGKDSSNVTHKIIGISTSGNICIGGTSTDSSQSDETTIYTYAYEMRFRWGSSTNKGLYYTPSGVIRPTTNNNISLGASSYKYKELYATNLYGSLDWSNVTNTPTTLANYGITDAQKSITVSSSEPTSADGADGDIWIVI